MLNGISYKSIQKFPRVTYMRNGTFQYKGIEFDLLEAIHLADAIGYFLTGNEFLMSNKVPVNQLDNRETLRKAIDKHLHKSGMPFMEENETNNIETPRVVEMPKDYILSMIYSKIQVKIDERIDHLSEILKTNNGGGTVCNFPQRMEEIQAIRSIINKAFYEAAMPRMVILEDANK